MKYLEFIFKTEPCSEAVNDVLAATLGEVGFESFVDSESGITAYIQQELYREELLKASLEDFPIENVSIGYTWSEAEDKDWNEEWEKNFFQPIVIGNRCVIHSTFHQDVPQAEYDIVINPQMAFGTGHHATTYLMIQQMLDMDFENKTVLDMGCGTSVLAIFAKHKGAGKTVAIDIDEWAYNNALENIRLNNTNDIQVALGGAEQIPAFGTFDIVFANINRNILLNDIRHYSECMKPGAFLYMSGFYVQDIPAIEEECKHNGLALLSHTEKNNWAAVKVQKQ